MKSIIAGRWWFESLCWVLAVVLIDCPALDAQAEMSGSAPSAQTERQAAVKARVLALPPGAIVELRLLDKQKIRGRIESHSDDGITVRTTPGTKVEIRFDQIDAVKSVKEKSRTEKALPWILVGLGAGAVVVMVRCAHTPGCGGA